MMVYVGLLLLAACLSSTRFAFAQRNQDDGAWIGKYKLEIGDPRPGGELHQHSRKFKTTQATEGRRLQAVSDVPGAPTSVYGTQSGLRTVVVSWVAPEDNNATITMYEITYNRTVQSGDDGASEGAVNATGSPAPTSVNVTGLITGSSYTFAVRAINSVGDGALSEGSDEVNLAPGKFQTAPLITLASYAAGEEGAANLTFTPSNPIPSDGHIIVEFPSDFTAVNSSSAVSLWGLDGGFTVSVDGYTVDIERDGTGSELGGGTNVTVQLVNGVKNQQFEGESDMFPVFKTTLSDTGTSIDAANSWHNTDDRPDGVSFVPGSFAEPPIVTLDSLVAGFEGAVNLSVTLSNPLPVDAHVILEFPATFAAIHAPSLVLGNGVDGGLNASVWADGYSVDIERDGSGTEVAAGAQISFSLVGCAQNQLWSGASGVFPSVTTTRQDTATSIDEASADFNSADRPSGVLFTPGAFQGHGPSVSLASYAAGEEGAANLTFTPSNPIPSDGHIIVEFPSDFTAVNSSSAVSLWGLDGGFTVSVDGYTVDIERDGTGSELGGGTNVTVQLVNGVKNQQFEGESDLFPVFKTTLSDTGTSIDAANSWHNTDDRPDGVSFVPGSFAEPPIVTLDSLVAGFEGAVNLNVTLSNPLPADGNIFIEFPSNFNSLSPTDVVASGMDGGLAVSVGFENYTVRVQRAGDGTDVEAGANFAITLVDGIKNQLFEGLSTFSPIVKTTLADIDVAIDDSREGPDPPALFFIAATLPVVGAALQYDVAGMETSITFSFTIENPLPRLAAVYLQFPSGFSSVSPTSAESDELGTLTVNGSFALTVQRDGSGDTVPAGTSVALTVSTVINRDTVGDTGNFSLTTFTESSMSKRIDVGVAASAVVGKQLLSTTAAFGSSSVAVASQKKRWTFFGHGVDLEDQVKWVNSSATSDDNCNEWSAEEVEIDALDGNSSTTSITFVEGSEATGPLQLCYQFSNGSHPFKLYPAITVDVYELYGVPVAEQGSTSLSVVGYAKVLTLSGFGTAEFDEARWLLQGSTNCSSAQYVAPLVSGGDGGDNEALVSSSFQASFEFTEDVFTQAGTGNASASATLCYKFGSEEFQHYPSMSMGIHYVNGWTSTVGGSSVAVAGVPEELSFTGYGISENVIAGDRARWILSGTNCSKNAAAISDATAIDGRVDVFGGQATFTFTPSTSGETPSLCYWFQDEPGVLFPSLAINVAFLSALSAPTFGDVDVAVVGYPKSWGFVGGHIENGDFVRWIYNDSSDCSDASSVPEMEEDGDISSGETTCTFAESVSGRWITPCYRHSSEPWRRYSMPVYVKMVHNVTASWGSDSACVIDQAKRWAFKGDGLKPDGDTDLIKFVINGTDCASNSDAPLTAADSDGVAMYLETDSTSTFIIESGAAGQLVNLCYKFGNEEFMWYDIRAFAHMVQSVGSRVGGKDIAVVDVEEVLMVNANGTSSQDNMRWVESNETSDAACNDSIIVWDSPNEGANATTDISIYEQGGYFLANFTFSASSAGLSPTLCYKFVDEPWKVYTDVTIDVAMLQEVHANEGSDNVAVVNYSKMWTMIGKFLADGDKVFWSASTCETASAAKLVGDDDGILRVDSTLAPWFVFDSPASGSIVHICYQFNEEPFKEYREFEIDIRMIRAVAADMGSPRKAIPGVAKTFSFIGDGTASEAGLDQVKWIDGDDCLANGILGDVEDAEGIFNFDLLYFDATGFTAQMIAFPEEEVGGPYAMCYSFDEEPYQVYEDLVMTVLGISDVTAEEGAADTIVVGALKRLNFTGGGAVEAGDQAVWVSGGRVDSDCLVTAFLSGPQSAVDSLNGAEFLIPDEDGEDKAGRTWTLCYRFGTESFKIYPAFSLTAVTLTEFSAAAGSDDDSVVEYPKTFHATGSGVAEGDMAKWVLASVSTDAGCEAGGVVDEGVVEWTMYTTVLESAMGNTTTAVDSTTATPTESSATTTSSLGEGLVLSSTFTFTTPTFSSATVQLCYKHQDEPYHLHPGITLRTRKLLSATIRELGTEQVLTSITNSPQVVAFVAVGGMEGDRYKWVPTTGTSTSETLFDLCAETVDPAAGSSVGVAAGFYQEASFTFTEPTSGLMLCYAPGSEPFMPYPEMTMEVLAPVISAANTTHLIAGRSTTVRLIGTFGLTSGDALKLADNADGDCDGDAAGGDETTFFPDATVSGLSGPTLGTSTISIYVSDRTEENRPYKLCYRFGTAGVWELFDNVSLEAYEITGASVNNGDGSPAAGDALDFMFSGTGIVDGDLAKWVGVSTSSDSECEAAPSAIGSSMATIVGGLAEFAFDGDVEDWVLCYKHGSDDWRLYTTIVPVSTSSASSADIAVSDTQRTQADVSFTMEGEISSYPEGSDARTSFLWAFLLDLARALGVDTSRFIVTGMRGGSVVVDFTIESTGSLADPSVTELLTNLDEQISDESSTLRTGNVTSAAKGLAYTTAVVADSTSTNSSATAIGVSVVEYQPKGLFGFTSTTWYTTEASGTVTLTIERDHGTKGVMDIGYSTSDGSATSGGDYESVAGNIVRFYDGDTSKTVDIPLVDDVETEAHFESFTVALSLQGPINEGAALMTTAAEATVLLYDYGDGVVLADATFIAKAKSSSATEGGVDDLALGWTITDNGGQSGWVDSNGFAAKDAVFGTDEYDDRCDYAATAPCSHDCTFGGGLAELFPTTGESPSVARLNSTGYVTTVGPVTDFPSTTLSFSFWIRAISTSGGKGGGTVVSYVAADASSSDSEILLHNLSGLSLLVHGKFVSAADRYDGPSGGDLGGIKTGIDVARDGAWHHVAVAWRSADGRVEAFIDGARVFDGGPYKTGAVLPTGGRLVLGQAQSSDCTSAEDVVAVNVSTSDPLECEVASGQRGPGGLEAEVQHLRLWSKFVTADEVAQQMQEPFEGNSVGQVLHWDFTPASMEGRVVEDSSGVGVSVSGKANDGLLSENGISLVQASPSLNPGYPCGVVHSGIWRFAGPEGFVTGLRNSTSYGGRLQFRLTYSAAIGDIRSTRGAVVIRSRGGQEISWNQIFDVAEAAPGQWTYVSVVLREDHGWLHEPLGTNVAMAEMKDILANASDLLIRGDLRVFGRSGGGQEVVYLQDVRLLAKA